MLYSSYQVERLLEHLRRFSRWLAWPAHKPWNGGDPVHVSRAAHPSDRDEQAAPAGRPAGALPPMLDTVRDARRFAPVVEQERERRAGSFMQPPYPDEPPASHVPKAGPRPTPRRRARTVGEGD
jgi:hypothetical protein